MPPMTRPQVTAVDQHKLARAMGAGLLIAACLLPFAGRAQDTTVSHGISTFGNLKYPADMAHLDYVNPDAPKGGEFSQWAFGTFDSMNPYSIQGVPAALASILYESILTSTADEIGASYCLLCTTMVAVFQFHPAAAAAVSFSFVSQRRAQANSVARMASPAGTTISAGPGVTIMSTPRITTVPPTMRTTMVRARRR